MASLCLRPARARVGSRATERQHARIAGLIVVATQRAAHAATGFITDAAGNALIRYADRSESASMMRACVSGIAELEAVECERSVLTASLRRSLSRRYARATMTMLATA